MMLWVCWMWKKSCGLMMMVKNMLMNVSGCSESLECVINMVKRMRSLLVMSVKIVKLRNIGYVWKKVMSLFMEKSVSLGGVMVVLLEDGGGDEGGDEGYEVVEVGNGDVGVVGVGVGVGFVMDYVVDE